MNNTITVDYQVPVDHPYFEGHFKQQAILPGIVVIDYSLYLLASNFPHLNKNLKKITRSKFTGFILPNDKIKIELLYLSQCQAKTIWTRNDKVLASINFDLI